MDDGVIIPLFYSPPTTRMAYWRAGKAGRGAEMVDALAREEGVPASAVSVDNW